MASPRVCDKCGNEVGSDDYIEDFFGGVLHIECFDVVAVDDEEDRDDGRD